VFFTTVIYIVIVGVMMCVCKLSMVPWPNDWLNRVSIANKNSPEWFGHDRFSFMSLVQCNLWRGGTTWFTQSLSHPEISNFRM
jgi:hypothetical protein